jgi:hypothetical protein
VFVKGSTEEFWRTILRFSFPYKFNNEASEKSIWKKCRWHLHLAVDLLEEWMEMLPE